MTRPGLLAAFAVTIGLAAAPQADAASLRIIGNDTALTVTADIAGLGLTAAPFGSASVAASDDGPVFTFPITGGLLDTATGNALVEHDGSGVALTAGARSAFVGNFLIDTAGSRLTGDAAAFGFGALEGVPLFDLGAPVDLGVPLLFTGELAGVLTDYFDAPDLSGATFGFARPDVAPIPLPAAAWLLLGGIAALGFAARRRAA